MEMFNDWIRLKLWQPATTEIIGLDGQAIEADPNGEDTFFEVIEMGPDVTKVGPGDVLACSFLQGMFRFKLPNDKFKSFALRECELLGRVLKGTPDARN